MVFPSQIDRIVKTIDDRKTQLEQEQKQWFWMHKERKHNKIEDLEALKTKLKDSGFNKQSLADFRSAHPELDKGYFFQRTRDMLDYISKLLPEKKDLAEESGLFAATPLNSESSTSLFAASVSQEESVLLSTSSQSIPDAPPMDAVKEAPKEKLKAKPKLQAERKNFKKPLPQELLNLAAQKLVSLGSEKLSQTNTELSHLLPAAESTTKEQPGLFTSSAFSPLHSETPTSLFAASVSKEESVLLPTSSESIPDAPPMDAIKETPKEKEIIRIKPNATIQSLPQELVSRIGQNLWPSELIAFSQTSSEFDTICNEDSVWFPHLSPSRQVLFNNPALYASLQNSDSLGLDILFTTSDEPAPLAIEAISAKEFYKKSIELFHFLKAMTKEQQERLHNSAVRELILNHKLTVEGALALTLEQGKSLSATSDLVLNNILSFEEAKNFNLLDKDFYDLRDMNPLIIKGKLTIKQAMDLTKIEFYNIDHTIDLILNDKLTVKEARNLTTEEASELWSARILILNDILTIKEALALTFMQTIYLRDIMELILHDKLTIEEALALPSEQKSNLKHIMELILHDKLTIEKVRTLTYSDCHNLYYAQNLILNNITTIEEVLNIKGKYGNLEYLESLIREGILTIAEALKFTIEQSIMLKNTQRVILNKRMTIQEILALTEEECYNLQHVCELILKNKMTIEDAKILTKDERSNLLNKTPLILKNILTVEKAKALTEDERYNLGRGTLILE